MAFDARVPLPRLPPRRPDGLQRTVRLVPQLRPVARRRVADHGLGAALGAPEREATRAKGARRGATLPPAPAGSLASNENDQVTKGHRVQAEVSFERGSTYSVTAR